MTTEGTNGLINAQMVIKHTPHQDIKNNDYELSSKEYVRILELEKPTSHIKNWREKNDGVVRKRRVRW